MAAMEFDNGRARSLRAARHRCPVRRTRSAGSASPTGTSNRARVIRLLAAGSSTLRMEIGMVILSSSTSEPCRSWYRRSPPVTEATKASLSEPPADTAACFRSGKFTAEHAQVPVEAPLGHHPGARTGDRLDEADDRARRGQSVGGRAQRIAEDVPGGGECTGQPVPDGTAHPAQVVSQCVPHELGRSRRSARILRRRDRASDLGVLRGLEEQEGQLRSADAVGQRMVDLHDQGGPVSGQAFDEGELPQWPREVETAHRLDAGILDHRGRGVRPTGTRSGADGRRGRTPRPPNEAPPVDPVAPADAAGSAAPAGRPAPGGPTGCRSREARRARRRPGWWRAARDRFSRYHENASVSRMNSSARSVIAAPSLRPSGGSNLSDVPTVPLRVEGHDSWGRVPAPESTDQWPCSAWAPSDIGCEWRKPDGEGVGDGATERTRRRIPPSRGRDRPHAHRRSLRVRRPSAAISASSRPWWPPSCT